MSKLIFFELLFVSKTYSNYLCHINLTICRFNIIHILYCLKLYTKLFFVITKIPKSCVRINRPYYFLFNRDSRCPSIRT